VAARQSWDRLRRLLATVPPETEPMPLQPPHKSLVVENANVVPPGEQKPVVCDLSLKLQRGNGLGVMAPALPVSHRSPACWSDIGRPGRARSALTALHCINGLRIYWDALLLSAAACRTAHRHRGAKHQPFRTRCRSDRDTGGSSDRRRPRYDRFSAERIRYANRPSRRERSRRDKRSA
jgi:hypothetical protein